MQEWIIAMLVVSILLILRDMAKTVFSGRTEIDASTVPNSIFKRSVEILLPDLS